MMTTMAAPSSMQSPRDGVIFDSRIVAAQADLKARVESESLTFSFKRLAPGAFNMGLIGSTCTASPHADLLDDLRAVHAQPGHQPEPAHHDVVQQVELESKV
jgi:hypothetical protein